MTDAVLFVTLLIAILNGNSSRAQDSWRDWSPDRQTLPTPTRPSTTPDRTKKEHKIRKTPMLDTNGNNVRIIHDPKSTIERDKE